MGVVSGPASWKQAGPAVGRDLGRGLAPWAPSRGWRQLGGRGCLGRSGAGSQPSPQGGADRRQTPRPVGQRALPVCFCAVESVV